MIFTRSSNLSRIFLKIAILFFKFSFIFKATENWKSKIMFHRALGIYIVGFEMPSEWNNPKLLCRLPSKKIYDQDFRRDRITSTHISSSNQIRRRDTQKESTRPRPAYRSNVDKQYCVFKLVLHRNRPELKHITFSLHPAQKQNRPKKCLLHKMIQLHPMPLLDTLGSSIKSSVSQKATISYSVRYAGPLREQKKRKDRSAARADMAEFLS